MSVAIASVVACTECDNEGPVGFDENYLKFNTTPSWYTNTKTMGIVCPDCAAAYENKMSPVKKLKNQVRKLKLQRKQSFNMLEKSIEIIANLVSTTEGNIKKMEEALRFAKECEELIS